ncbi:MAG: cation diffusion facilitator family transporter [Lapillicoccus sp.]
MHDTALGRDQRLLLLSVWISAGFAAVSSVWGILAGSSMIVFDGVYSFVSVGLSGVAVITLRFSRRGADERFPWGREAAEPLVVVLKAGTLGVLSLYAAVVGVLDIVRGGHDVELGWAVVYAALATVVALVVGVVLRRGSGPDERGRAGSGLVRAEAAEWLGDALLSGLVLIGFLVALVLEANDRTDLAAYVDPGMVVLGSLVFLRVPVQLIVSGIREVLSMAPPADVLEDIRARVRDVGDRFGFDEPVVRAAKVGSRMDVEVDYVLGDDARTVTVADCDAVRQEVHDRLAEVGYERSVVVTFTGDRRWAQ